MEMEEEERVEAAEEERPAHMRWTYKVRCCLIADRLLITGACCCCGWARGDGARGGGGGGGGRGAFALQALSFYFFYRFDFLVPLFLFSF